MVFGTIWKIITAFIPASRMEIWRIKSEIQGLYELNSSEHVMLNSRIAKMEGKYGGLDRWIRKDEHDQATAEALETRKEQLIQLLPEACKKMGIPEDKAGQIASVIASNPEKVDEFLGQLSKSLPFIPKKLTVETVVLGLQLGAPVINQLWPKLGGLLKGTGGAGAEANTGAW